MESKPPATAPIALPKSKSHRNRSHVPASAKDPTPAASPVYEAVEAVSVHQASFKHPKHTIPSRTYSGFEDLIIVCCHAIFHPPAATSSFPLQSPYDEGNWHLSPFQKSNSETGKPGEHETFLSHITAGLDALTSRASGERSLLVFSGGVTKSDVAQISEARSYYHASLALSLYQGEYAGGRAKTLFDRGRILLEEYATDSFQNLLLSILSFRQTTGYYPKRIRIITHAFKSKRFLELHAPTINWPMNRVRVQGIDPIMSSAEYEDTTEGEQQYGYALWKHDPLGTREILTRKREQRGWDADVIKELGKGLEPSVIELLNGKMVEDLPWVAINTAIGTSKVDSMAFSH